MPGGGTGAPRPKRRGGACMTPAPAPPTPRTGPPSPSGGAPQRPVGRARPAAGPAPGRRARSADRLPAAAAVHTQGRPIRAAQHDPSVRFSSRSSLMPTPRPSSSSPCGTPPCPPARVHVLVEGQERAYQRAPVRDGDAHAIIDVREHLRALGHGHGAGGSRRPRAFALAARCAVRGATARCAVRAPARCC